MNPRRTFPAEAGIEAAVAEDAADGRRGQGDGKVAVGAAAGAFGEHEQDAYARAAEVVDAVEVEDEVFLVAEVGEHGLQGLVCGEGVETTVERDDKGAGMADG